ncbi:MAG: 50S ribosomal protein L3 N(5)-glutamine methyltransferase [Proteobacteria bacterium]|nr:50S ribosomal protein L3 N(5)-glutamine methyltransferase [Pseudomonadota bacterium]
MRKGAPPKSAREHVLAAEKRFVAAGLVFGHGTDNARDEAVFLVFDALSLPFNSNDTALDRALTGPENLAVSRLIDKRIESRKPAAYLTHHMRFAGHDFYVDERVLVPRSPIAELINSEFHPWLDVQTVKRVLEIGTGSGCIAIATALALPHATVDAIDISPDALIVAELNRTRFAQVSHRVRFIEADLFPTSNERYDLIVTNPPYVPSDECEQLPAEYLHEPRLALDAGADGLTLVRRIVAGAAKHLNAGGHLIIDVGEMAPVVDSEISTVNFTWVDLLHGGAGIGVAGRNDFM